MSEAPVPSRDGAPALIGLALSGGAAMGLAHIGVVDALAEAGIAPAAVAGTSMGALVGAFVAAGKLESLRALALSQKRHWWLKQLDLDLLGTGLIGGRRIARMLTRHFGDTTIEDLPVPFAASAVDLANGRAVVQSSGPLVAAVRASIAVPGLMAGIARGREFLVDGCLLDPVPVAAARALGAARVIAVNLYTDQAGEALAAGLIPSDPATGRTRIGRPGVRTVAVAAQGVMLRRIAEASLAETRPELVIVPKVAHLGLMSYHRAAEFIAEGARAARAALADAGSGWTSPTGSS